jgi:hypothetical protein
MYGVYVDPETWNLKSETRVYRPLNLKPETLTPCVLACASMFMDGVRMKPQLKASKPQLKASKTSS